MKLKKIIMTVFYTGTALFLLYLGIALGHVDWNNLSLDCMQEDFISAFFILKRPVFTRNTPVAILGVYCIAVLAWLWNYSNKRNYMPGKEFGTARLVSPGTINRITEDRADKNNNKILSEHVRKKYDLQNVNNNMIVIGGSGAGKTFYMVKPNAFNAFGSLIFTDPKGGAIRSAVKSCGTVCTVSLFKFEN